MSILVTRSVMLFVDDPTIEKAETMLSALLECDNADLVLSSVKLCLHRNLMLVPTILPDYSKLVEMIDTSVLYDQAFNIMMNTYYPEHIINPDASVRSTAVRQWFNYCRTLVNKDLPRWKSEEEMLNE